MSNKKAKDILKKLGYNKYYEHIPFIKDKFPFQSVILSTPDCKKVTIKNNKISISVG